MPRLINTPWQDRRETDHSGIHARLNANNAHIVMWASQCVPIINTGSFPEVRTADELVRFLGSY